MESTRHTITSYTKCLKVLRGSCGITSRTTRLSVFVFVVCEFTTIISCLVLVIING
jgi:hypothetical protein